MIIACPSCDGVEGYTRIVDASKFVDFYACKACGTLRLLKKDEREAIHGGNTGAVQQCVQDKSKRSDSS